MGEKYKQPVKVGDIIEESIINIGSKGDGIARYKEFVIIVPNVDVEKTYKIRIDRVFPTFSIGEAIEEVI